MPIPVKKILIANRGEIALRIIRAAKELGITVTGIYSSADINAPWIRQCHESWLLEGSSLSDTYLNINKIISIARKSGSDAIHPGYGFLAENYRFAEACALNGITFIGPSTAVLKLMGDKPASHEWVKQLGIKVPDKITGTAEELLEKEELIHYPVLVKAATGGGGKGMRVVTGSHQLRDILKTTSGEASLYFADGRVFIETYLQNSRHIEVQILGDLHGNIIHLFERECSVQRRHQKLIEESPATNLSEPSRNKIIHAAINIASSVQYTGAGTIEFLLDDNDNFHFLEMNPRIQVEHGITEMVTGIDIVKEQILIAGGKPLSISGKDVRTTGHAMEARVYAEDPENDLLPSPGNIYFFNPPDIPGVRIETAVENNSPILNDFDPLIAKIIVHTDSRDHSMDLMKQVVRNFAITGIKHNLSLLNSILEDEDFVGNRISTQYLDMKLPVFKASVKKIRKNTDLTPYIIAAALLVITGKKTTDSPWDYGYWRSVRQIRFRLGKEIIELDYDHECNGTYVFFDSDKKYLASQISIDPYYISFGLNNKTVRLFTVPEKDGILEISDGHLDNAFERFYGRESEFAMPEREQADGADDLVLAPQPGTIMEIKVAEGQQVSRGDNLLTIESMKLENTILAVRSGCVKKITIKAGDKVRKNEPLIYMQESTNN